MQCPTDGAVLVMSERSGIEIDYCPTCRGVWLDRGELDKIIERAAQEFGAAAPRAASQPAQQPYPPQPPAASAPPQGSQNPIDMLRQASRGYDDRGYDQRGYDQRGYDQGHYRKKKKDNWLSELFD